MKRVSLLILGTGFGILTLFALTAVFQQNNERTLFAKDGAVNYAIVDLGTLGGDESVVEDLNNGIEIVGSSTISDSEGLTAFLWREGNMAPLTSAQDATSRAIAINDSSVIAGTVISGSGETAEQWPVLWSGETMTKLETIDELPGTARAINNNGLIAGSTLANSNNHLLLWQDTQLTTTIPISGGIGWANGLNDDGHLVGSIEDSEGTNFAFLWQDGSFTNLGTLGGSSSSANDINESLQIVGSASISGDMSSHAFIWQDGLMQGLDGLSEAMTATSKANSINNLGIVVGQAQLGEEDHAVMWQEGQIIDLNILLPAESEWDSLISAESINEAGWIAGTGLMGGKKRAFLLRPLPLLNKRYLPIIMAIGNTATPTPTITSTPTNTPTATSTMEPTETPTPIPEKAVDLTDYMIGDGTLYEVQHSSGSQARHQTQIDEEDVKIFYHTKGNEVKAEWEELWSTRDYIYRGTDTSPGHDEYYTLYEGSEAGSPWSPRHWKVGEKYERNPYVVFYSKSDCSIVASGFQRSWLRFEERYDEYTFESGITLENVIKLAWLLHPDGQPIENYFYAQDFGLVGWGSSDRGFSYISEIHAPGQRPDNLREVIPCISDHLEMPLLPNNELNFGPLPEPWASRVK